MLTILTPTYNRSDLLEKAYHSLLKQTNKNFEWFVVDDGSTDDTEKVMKQYQKENKIKIQYVYQENGGKHTALNEGIKRIKTDYILILDSDDQLTEDCVEFVYHKWKQYDSNKKIGCLSFLKVFPNHEVIGKKYEEQEIQSNHIDFRYNRNLLGDMCEVFRTSVLKQYPFPVFSGERFLSEAIIWNKIALEYDTVYINHPIYIAEYLEGGLSQNSLKLRYNNPVGALENAKVFMNSRFKISIRFKNAILYDGFSLIAKRKVGEIISKSDHKFLSIFWFPGGVALYLWLTNKYKQL